MLKMVLSLIDSKLVRCKPVSGEQSTGNRTRDRSVGVEYFTNQSTDT